jgi:hypothetical protein
MNITKEAVAMINRLGSGTVDDLLPLMPYTRAQLFRALKHAADSGQLDTDGWRAPTGPSTGSPPATYRALRKTYVRPAASVWQFAASIGEAA